MELQIDQLDNAGDSKVLNRYDGGLNDTDSNEILRDNESIIRQNWGNDERGALVKVNGFTVKNAIAVGSTPILGLFRAYQSDGTKKLLAVSDTKLFFSDDDGATFTGATNGTGLSASAFNTGVNYNDLFFFTNATDNLQHYTPGTDTMAASTDTPNDPCEILLKRSDRRMIALVNSVNGSTLYYSKIDPTGVAGDDWSAANDAGSIAIDGAKSEPLTGGMTFGAVDIIFKDYAAFKVWGYPTPFAVRLSGSPGCAAPRSVAQGEGVGFFLGHSDIWLYDGNKFIKISDTIKSKVAQINQSKIRNAWGIYRDGLYWLFYTKSGDTVNKNVLIYDVRHSNPYEGRNIWYERPGLEMNAPVVFDGVGDANELYAGVSASTGFVNRLDFSATGADNTSKIQAVNQTKYFNFKLPKLVKRFSKIHITYFSSKGDILVNWFTNRGAKTGNFSLSVSQTGVKLGTFLLGTDILSEQVERTHTERLPDTAIGKDISLKITHNDTGDSPIIRNIEVEWEAMYVE